MLAIASCLQLHLPLVISESGVCVTTCFPRAAMCIAASVVHHRHFEVALEGIQPQLSVLELAKYEQWRS